MVITTTTTLAVDAGGREWGVAVFVNQTLQFFTIKSLPHHLSREVRITKTPELLSGLLAEFRPAVLILTPNRPRPRATQLVIHQMKDLAQAQTLCVQQYTLRVTRLTICSSPCATKRQMGQRLMKLFPALKFYVDPQTKQQSRHYRRMFDAIAAGYTHVMKTANKQGTGRGVRNDCDGSIDRPFLLAHKGASTAPLTCPLQK